MAKNFTAEYRLLGKLRSDCEYFLGYGGADEGVLWKKSISQHISEMKQLYDLVPEKPEWLTMEQINGYEARMRVEKDRHDVVYGMVDHLMELERRFYDINDLKAIQKLHDILPEGPITVDEIERVQRLADVINEMKHELEVIGRKAQNMSKDLDAVIEEGAQRCSVGYQKSVSDIREWSPKQDNRQSRDNVDR